jgi:hypothetical protein
MRNLWTRIRTASNPEDDIKATRSAVMTLCGPALEAVVGGLNPQPLPPRMERE